MSHTSTPEGEIHGRVEAALRFSRQMWPDGPPPGMAVFIGPSQRIVDVLGDLPAEVGTHPGAMVAIDGTRLCVMLGLWGVRRALLAPQREALCSLVTEMMNSKAALLVVTPVEGGFALAQVSPVGLAPSTSAPSEAESPAPDYAITGRGGDA